MGTVRHLIAPAAAAASIALLALPAVASAGASVTESFPAKFQWGVAGAGFQTEMGGGSANSDPNTDWWTWVHDPSNVSSNLVSGDLPEDGPGGWKTNFAADIANANALHMTNWRMGIEWSRIFPTSTASVKIGSTVSTANLKALDKLANKAAVAKYRSILTAVRAARMNPMVTLSHFTLPLWIHDPIHAREVLAARRPDDPVPVSLAKAGWLANSTVSEFRKYAAYAAWKFGDLVDWWTPVNEPMVMAAFGYTPGGTFPPGVTCYRCAMKAATDLVAANAAAYDEIHARDSKDADKDGKKSQVGPVQNMIHFVPANGSIADAAATAHADWLFNRLLLEAEVKGRTDTNADGTISPEEISTKGAGKADFIGVNYYFRGTVQALGFPLSGAIPTLDFFPTTTYSWALNPTAPACPTTCSEFGSELDTEGFAAVLREAASYGKPLIVTENGIADADDSQRPAYLVGHLDQLQHVAAEKPNGVKVLGYYEWSLTDNFEWASGYTPKFGLYSFDPVTLTRTARPSAALLGGIAGANAISGQLLASYVASAPGP